MATFILRTGKQGNGKTLNSIKEIDLKAHKEGRTVYYCNITDFKPDHPAIKAEWVEFDHPETWYELPKNAIIVIDEAQTWFRVRPQGSKVPLYASRLEIMRKDGHELHAITQSPKLIDSHMRELCGQHIHYYRGRGGKIIKRWEFDQPVMNVGEKLDFPDGESTRITVDSTYFGCYRSVKEGAEHHFKFRAPKALYIFAAIVVVVSVIIGRFAYKHVLSDPEQAQPVASAQEQPQSYSSPTSVGEAVSMTADDYANRMVPRIADVPASAPIYDQLTAAQTFPKPFCVATNDSAMIERNSKRMALGYDADGMLSGCRCNTQQGTRLDVSFQFCMNVVTNGYFDHTKPDRQASDYPGSTAGVTGRDGAAGTYGGAGVSSPATQPAAPSRFTMVDHSKPQPAEYVPQRPSSGFVVVGSGNPGHLW